MITSSMCYSMSSELVEQTAIACIPHVNVSIQTTGDEHLPWKLGNAYTKWLGCHFNRMTPPSCLSSWRIYWGRKGTMYAIAVIVVNDHRAIHTTRSDPVEFCIEANSISYEDLFLTPPHSCSLHHLHLHAHIRPKPIPSQLSSLYTRCVFAFSNLTLPSRAPDTHKEDYITSPSVLYSRMYIHTHHPSFMPLMSMEWKIGHMRTPVL